MTLQDVQDITAAIVVVAITAALVVWGGWVLSGWKERRK